MRTIGQTRKGAEKILSALAQFDYLTAAQITRLCYSENSLSFVRKKLAALTHAGFVLALPRQLVTLPHIYTLTSTGYTYAAALDMQAARRVRPVDERDKAKNLLFLQHTLAVNDVLIAAHLLAQTHPAIVLTRMYTERELKRKIYVAIPESCQRKSAFQTRREKILIEPDASCEFAIHREWEDFFFIEVYRNLPPMEWRFKQKIAGYVTYALNGQHEALFQTPAIGIAVIATTDGLTPTLKRWTEEVLHKTAQPERAGLFFFCSLDPATASPEELFLSPVWEQAFGTTKTPLLMLAEESE
jgi:hypothetical protein